MNGYTTIKNVSSGTQINQLFATGDNIIIWRNSLTGNVFLRLPNSTDVPVTASGGINIVGGLDPTGNIDFPAGQVGDLWFFTADGSIGAPPEDVQEGETITCITDTAGGAGAAADFIIGQVNLIPASETEAGFARFCTIAELIAGVADNIMISPLNFTDILTNTGISNLRSLLFEPPTTGDPAILKSQDAPDDGSAANGARVEGGEGGDDPAAGGRGGNAQTQPGKGGETTDAASTAGDGGDSVNVGADGGDAAGAGSTGGDGGDAIVGGGAPGAGATPGKDGIIDHRSLLKSLTVTGLVALPGGGQAGATALTAVYNKIGTVATAGDSVLATSALEGRTQTIVNNGAESTDVFPEPGDNFEGLAADVAVPVAVGANIKIHCFDDGQFDFV